MASFLSADTVWFCSVDTISDIEDFVKKQNLGVQINFHLLGSFGCIIWPHWIQQERQTLEDRHGWILVLSHCSPYSPLWALVFKIQNEDDSWWNETLRARQVGGEEISLVYTSKSVAYCGRESGTGRKPRAGTWDRSWYKGHGRELLTSLLYVTCSAFFSYRTHDHQSWGGPT